MFLTALHSKKIVGLVQHNPSSILFIVVDPDLGSQNWPKNLKFHFSKLSLSGGLEASPGSWSQDHGFLGS
jgi:hypothetical protein